MQSSAGAARPTFKTTVDATSALSVVTDDGRLSGVSSRPRPLSRRAPRPSSCPCRRPRSPSLHSRWEPRWPAATPPLARCPAARRARRSGSRPSAVGQQIGWTMSGLTAGTKYVVRTGSVKTGTVTADSAGNVASTLTATGTTEVQIKVSTT